MPNASKSQFEIYLPGDIRIILTKMAEGETDFKQEGGKVSIKLLVFVI